jgi:hypothetical protein
MKFIPTSRSATKNSRLSEERPSGSEKVIGVKFKHLTFGLRHNGPEINTGEDRIMLGNSAVDYVESQVLQLFEADRNLGKPGRLLRNLKARPRLWLR